MEFDATLYVLVTSTSEKSSTIKLVPRVEEKFVSVDVPEAEETTKDVEDKNETMAITRPKE